MGIGYKGVGGIGIKVVGYEEEDLEELLDDTMFSFRMAGDFYDGDGYYYILIPDSIGSCDGLNIPHDIEELRKLVAQKSIITQGDVCLISDILIY